MSYDAGLYTYDEGTQQFVGVEGPEPQVDQYYYSYNPETDHYTHYSNPSTYTESVYYQTYLNEETWKEQ